jgi:hypothetical protein
VVSVALLIGFAVISSVQGLVNDLNSALPRGVEGSIALSSPDRVRFGTPIHFASGVYGDTPTSAHAFISVSCFKGNTLVFGHVMSEDVPISIAGDRVHGPWSCSASLMYRVTEGSINTLFLVDSISFEVSA